MVNEEVSRPRIIDTSQYVKDRISQIAELLEVVDNTSLPAGEVTSRKRTVLQRLPRHMRRRAMSHNIKRLPKMIRNMAMNAIKKATRHRKKPPSRKWRRRPSRLLNRRNRVLRRFNWLETHIWHAKRFLMSDLWGYKLPIRSYQKGFRPTYRNAINSTAVFDQSYLECIQIESSKSQEEVCRAALSGCLEMSVLIYMPKQYPRGFLGPGRFSWSTVNDINRLQLWVHPSIRSVVLNEIVEIFNAKPSEPIEIGDIEKKSSEVARRSFVSQHYTVSDLSHDLVRLQLVGPEALELLRRVLQLVSVEELSELGMSDFYRKSHEFWSKSVDGTQPGSFRNGSVISLIVEDPRLFLASKQKQDSIMKTRSSSSCDAPLPCTLFWDKHFRKRQLLKRYSNAELVKRRAEKLGALRSTPFKIPILIVIRNATTNRGTVSANRADLIAPGGTGLDFWLALQFADGRAAGLLDKIHLDFEAGLTSFPSDCGDSLAGLEFGQIDYATRMAKYLKKPFNRRINYQQSLHVQYPFSFEWKELVRAWNKDDRKKHVAEASDIYYVLRDRRVLISLSNWLDGKGDKSKAECILKEHSRALIPVKLQQLSRGTSKRLALIFSELMEPIKMDELAQKENGNCVSKIFPDYIPLQSEPGRKLISLNDMFPDEQSAKHQLNVKKREKRKSDVKRKKIEGVHPCASEQQIGEVRVEVSESLNTELISYENRCSRSVIGRIVRGDYSFVDARGISYGFCPAVALGNLQNRLVMLRNVTSRLFLSMALARDGRAKSSPWTISELDRLAANEDNFLAFLNLHHVVPLDRVCPKCDKPGMTIQKRKNMQVRFRCGKRAALTGKSCNGEIGLLKSTFLQGSKTPILVVLKFIYLWLSNMELRKICDEIGLGTCAAVEWARFCRRAVYQEMILNGNAIGGLGDVV
uniref:Ribonucleases P/MRP protein subunit POP1 n=1 Tax=Ditylenchus dipsaci TaxID=166011 RepID=A0A915DT52_9BILA